MSVVIVGGNERMERQYKDICKRHGCRAKVFAKMPADFKKKIGSPDLVILFTSTVSHKIVECATTEAKQGPAGIQAGNTAANMAAVFYLDGLLPYETPVNSLAPRPLFELFLNTGFSP